MAEDGLENESWEQVAALRRREIAGFHPFLRASQTSSAGHRLQG